MEIMYCGLLPRVVLYKLTNISEVLIAYVIKAIVEVVRTSETSVHFCETTKRNIQSDLNTKISISVQCKTRIIKSVSQISNINQKVDPHLFYWGP
jgi:hypothetical protein